MHLFQAFLKVQPTNERCVRCHSKLMMLGLQLYTQPFSMLTEKIVAMKRHSDPSFKCLF